MESIELKNQVILSHKRKSFKENIILLYRYRELLVTWTLRDIRGRYRQSALGFGWALIQPFIQMVVISIIFGYFLQIPSGDIPYPIFSYVAILPWTLFSGSISSAVPSVIVNMELVNKIYFPREIIPLSAILSRMVDFAIASLVFVGLMLFYRIPLAPTILYVPLLLVIQITLAIGVGLLGSAISVFFRDISFAVPLGMQIWMYATPVIYSIASVPEEWRGLYLLNPMAGIIASYRQVILYGENPNISYLIISALVSVIICVFAYVYFKRLEMAMSDII